MRRRDLVLGAAFVGALMVAHACGGGLGVGRIQEGERARVYTPEDIKLEPAYSLLRAGSPSPVWSPDGGALAFIEGYSVIQVELETGEEHLLLDSSATLSADVEPMRYSACHPAYLDQERVLVGSDYLLYLGASPVAPRHQGMVLSTTSTPQPFGYGYNPTPHPSEDRIAFELIDGVRVVNGAGEWVEDIQGICQLKWDNSGGYYALKFGEGGRCEDAAKALIHVDKAGNRESLWGPVVQYAIHPSEEKLVIVEPDRHSTHWYPRWNYGSVYAFDPATRRRHLLGTGGRDPVFLQSPPMLFFESHQGLVASDLKNQRLFPDIRLAYPKVSPEGDALVGSVFESNQAWLKVYNISLEE